MTHPIVGRTTLWSCILPNVPIALCAIARGAAFDEPGMLVRRVIGHEIEDHLEAATMSLGDQARAIGCCAEERIHSAIVSDVIAELAMGDL